MRTVPTLGARSSAASGLRLWPSGARRRARLAGLLVLVMVSTAALASCGIAGAAHLRGRLVIVAAENTWGSLVSQLAGDRALVVSVVSNPNADPHAYEPTPQDARTVAAAQYVVVNGAGYDTWASRLVDANPSSDRRLLSIADLAGRREGDNPHMWYSPRIVSLVVDRVTRDLEAIDPGGSAGYTARHRQLLTSGFAEYDSLLAAIRSRSGDVPVGATESIVVDLASEVGLDLITPPAYMRAVAEGTDPTAGDKRTVDEQVASRHVRVLLVNGQNSTSDVQRLAERAGARGIPVVTVTETLSPAGASFQQWQVAQLTALVSALRRGVGSSTALGPAPWTS